MKRIALVAIMALTLSLAVSTGVLAATLGKSVPATVTVVDYVPGLEVFADEAGTTPVGVISFGSVHRGETSAPRTFYVKNTGELPFSAVNVTLTSGVGTASVSGSGVALAVGASAPITVSFTPAATATFQVHNLQISVAANY